MELKRSIQVIVSMVREDIQELTDQIKALAGDVGDLEDWADAFGHELCGSIDALFTVLDEYGNFSRSWRFEDSRYLLDSLLQDLWWTDVDFGYDNHDGNIQRQCDAQVLFTHANEAIISCYHK